MLYRLGKQLVGLDVIYDCPLDDMPLDRSFGELDRDMERKLMEWQLSVLREIKESKQSSRKILPLPRQKNHFLALQSIFLCQHDEKKHYIKGVVKIL